MITTKNNYSGAAFDYSNEGKCSAYGDYRCAEDKFKYITIEGRYTDGGNTYPFSANRDEYGNVAISGVPFDILPEVATEVKTIISEIEEAVFPENE